jgi:hypothetical protein
VARKKPAVTIATAGCIWWWSIALGMTPLPQSCADHRIQRGQLGSMRKKHDTP